jgi:hypothetical protein
MKKHDSVNRLVPESEKRKKFLFSNNFLLFGFGSKKKQEKKIKWKLWDVKKNIKENKFLFNLDHALQSEIQFSVCFFLKTRRKKGTKKSFSIKELRKRKRRDKTRQKKLFILFFELIEFLISWISLLFILWRNVLELGKLKDGRR